MRYQVAGSEEFSLRELVEMLLGEEGRRKLVLRQKRNDELFHLYETELVLRLRSQMFTRNLPLHFTCCSERGTPTTSYGELPQTTRSRRTWF